MTHFLPITCPDSSQLSLYGLQLKTIAILCLGTMARPRSDIGCLQFRDVKLRFQDDTNQSLHFREPKETQVKTSKSGLLQDQRLCLTTILYSFIQKTLSLRTSLPLDHTLFLAYIKKPSLVCSIRPSTLSNWVKLLMQKSGVDETIFKAHSIWSASSTKAVERAILFKR